MSSVRVRMYRQGLGDCFLLTFDGDGQTRHALIDCGVLKGTAAAGEKMQRVAEHIRDTAGHLDVLVATHEHWDHVSGFLQAEEVFKELSVGEVWLAWTEDDADDLANELRRRREQTLRALEGAVRRLDGVPAERISGLLEFHGDLGVGAHQTTRGALEAVKGKEGAKLRFLRPGELLSELGVRVFVLGPPHDREQIRRSDPSARHSEVYGLTGPAGPDGGFLAAIGDEASGGAPGRQPFDRWSRVTEDEARTHLFFRDRYHAEDQRWRGIEEEWLLAAGGLALRLDADTNNTSLALAFELGPGGPVLLFPGDAQVGNWASWEALAWSDGEAGTVTAADLLARTVLYKVGHHGSHNATLREKGLELMSSPELVAMIPVDRPTAAHKGWEMPFGALLDRLRERTRGRIIDAELGISKERPSEATAAQWQRFLERSHVEERSSDAPGWIDYTIEF